MEFGPREDGQANGRAERAVRSVEETVRIGKRDLELRLDSPIDPTGSLFEWIVRHATDLLNKRGIGADGQSAYQRLRGRPYKGELMRFGNRMMHRLSGKVQGGALVDRWNPGFWIGKHHETDEHLVATDVGTVLRARTVRDLDEKTCAETLFKIRRVGIGQIGSMNMRNVDEKLWTKSAPPKPRTAAEPEGQVSFDNAAVPAERAPLVQAEDMPPEIPVDGSKVTRQWQITVKHLREHGYTPGCKGCRAQERGLARQDHEKSCRARLEECIRKVVTDAWSIG